MTEDLHNEVVRLWRGGMSMRKIARLLGISRHQVKAIVLAHDTGRQQGRTALQSDKIKRPRASQLDDHEETIAHLLARYPDITAVRVHEELGKLGFAGSYSLVKQRLQKLRPRKRNQFIQRFETGPGVQAQMDYATYTIDFTGEGRRKVQLFGYVLGYSRRQYLRFVDSQDFTTTIREHVRAFEYFGGCTATCLYDNMKVVVSGYDGDEPIYNTRFLAFATHYGYRPIACRPRRPQTKGKIERQFFYVEKNLLNGRTFHSLKQLNDVTRHWLQTVADQRIHRETKQTPWERYQEERTHLIELPEHPYDTAEVVYRCVSGEGLIAYCQNRYSVPWRYIGSTLPVRVTEKEVIIYGPAIEEIARHPLQRRSQTGQTVRLKQHQPSDDAEKKFEILRQRFEELGEIALRFLEGLLKQRRYGKDEAQKVLALLEIYRRDDLLAALGQAVRYGAYSRSAIERILAVKATPKTTLDQLADKEQQQLKELLDDLPVPPRPATEYQTLLFDETDNHADEEDTEDSPEREPGPSPEDP